MVSTQSWASHSALCSVQVSTRYASGSNVSLHRKAKIGALIKKNGGKHSTKVSGEEESWWVTHLVTTAKHIEAQAEKGETSSSSSI